MLLFQTTDPTDPASSTGPYGSLDFGKQVEEETKKALNFNEYQEFFLKLEDQAVKTSRSLAGSIKGYSQILETTMFNVMDATISIGGSQQDVLDFAEQYAATTGKVPPLIEEQVIEAVKLSKEFGVTTKEIAAMVGQMSQLGLGQAKAIDTMKKIGETARKYGVNAGALTKTVQENIKKSVGYTFKDGIKGLTEMAAQAQRLGMSIDSSFSLYKDFLDPDKAIEFASEVSMLGGEFAKAFGDPYANMNKSVDEIQQSLIDAASASATFNEKTGEYEISRQGQQALLAFTEKYGGNFEELSAAAAQSAKQMEVMNQVGFQPDISEEDRSLLSSMAEKGKDGTWKVQLPGTEEWINVSEVNAENMKEFADAAKYKEKDIKDVNASMLSTAERQLTTLNEIKMALVRQGGLEGGDAVKKSAENLNQAALNFESLTLRTKTTYDTLITTMNAATEATTKWIKDTLPKLIGVMIDEANSTTTLRTEDLFLPNTAGETSISGPEGSFLTIPNDEVLAAPNISEFINSSMGSFKKLNDLESEISKGELMKARAVAESIGKNLEDIGDPFAMMSKNKSGGATLQNAMGGKPTNLGEVMSSNVTTNVNTTNTQKVEGGFTITIDASKVPNSLDPTMLKNEIMSVMYKLGDEMKKQGVLNFKI